MSEVSKSGCGQGGLARGDPSHAWGTIFCCVLGLLATNPPPPKPFFRPSERLGGWGSWRSCGQQPRSPQPPYFQSMILIAILFGLNRNHEIRAVPNPAKHLFCGVWLDRNSLFGLHRSSESFFSVLVTSYFEQEVQTEIGVPRNPIKLKT